MTTESVLVKVLWNDLIIIYRAKYNAAIILHRLDYITSNLTICRSINIYEYKTAQNYASKYMNSGHQLFIAMYSVAFFTYDNYNVNHGFK